MTTNNRGERRVMALACRWLTEEEVKWLALTAYECAVQHFIETYPPEDADFARRQLAGDVSDIFAALLLEAGRQKGIEGLSSDPQQLRGYLGTQRRDNGSKLSYVARYTLARLNLIGRSEAHL